MKKFLLGLVLLSTLNFHYSVSHAQEPLFDIKEMPNAVFFLPPPPDTASAAFQYDKAQYRWGLEQRKDSVRRAIAVSDAVWGVESICRILSKPFGMKISPKTTPAIYKMMNIGLITTDQIGKLPKEKYMRTRPYVYFGEPTIVPGDEEELSHSGSYPSGHTILGWSAALLLCEVNPDSANAILARAYMHGQSRVVAGFHWQSDVDAGRLAASAAVARLHADPTFLLLMEKARKEFENLRIQKNPLKIDKSPKSSQPTKLVKPINSPRPLKPTDAPIIDKKTKQIKP